MKTKDQHIIQNLSVEIESNSLSRAEEIKLNSSAFIEQNVLSIIETYIANVENTFGEVTVQLSSLNLAVDFEEGQIGFLEVKSSLESQLDAIFEPIIRSLSTKEKKGEGFKIQKRSFYTGSKQAEVEMLSPKDRKVKSIIYFIETGKAPWWIKTHDELRILLEDSQWIALLKENRSFSSQLKKGLSSPLFRKRFIQQISNHLIIESILELEAIETTHAQRNSKSQKQKFQSFLNSLQSSQRYTLLECMIEQLIVEEKKMISIEELQEVFEEKKSIDVVKNLQEMEWVEAKEASKYLRSLKSERLSKKNEKQGEREKKVKKEGFKDLKREDQVQKEANQSKNNSSKQKKVKAEKRLSKSTEFPAEMTGIVSENAGLVLLQPFFKPFLKNLNLLSEENELIDPVLTVHILHFLATGKEEDYEFSMVLEAFLCGVSLDEPLLRNIQLSEEIKAACHELLLAVLGHWKALKSDSIPLLRNEFLQREGKLITDEVSPRIVVERTTIDILLDKLPWTLSMLKLPWLEEMIYVEW